MSIVDYTEKTPKEFVKRLIEEIYKEADKRAEQIYITHVDREPGQTGIEYNANFRRLTYEGISFLVKRYENDIQQHLKKIQELEHKNTLMSLELDTQKTLIEYQRELLTTYFNPVIN